MKHMKKGLLIRGGHGGGSSSINITLSPAAEASTAFDNVNLLSAPRVEYERPFYCIEKGEQLSQREQFARCQKDATVRGSWGKGGCVDDHSIAWCVI